MSFCLRLKARDVTFQTIGCHHLSVKKQRAILFVIYKEIILFRDELRDNQDNTDLTITFILHFLLGTENVYLQNENNEN